jgi:hypothetical protein
MQICAAATRRDQPAAGPQRVVKTTKQSGVIEYPVERRGAEDCVGAFEDGQG